ncbi:hypothetical protein Tco_1201682 [Tanacetum coccineum]
MIKEIDKDETINVDKSRELGKSHDTAEHRMESEHDDDDRTLAETLLNIKRSATKGKAIMQESEPPNKIKKKEIIHISLDDEFAKSFYEEEQAQILQDKFLLKQLSHNVLLMKNTTKKQSRTYEGKNSDNSTLTNVRTVLHDIASNLRMDYLPKKIWSSLDRKRSRIMIKAIDQLLLERRLMRSLEKVGGRDYGEDLRLLERTT